MTELKLEKKKTLGFISSFMIHVSFDRHSVLPRHLILPLPLLSLLYKCYITALTAVNMLCFAYLSISKWSNVLLICINYNIILHFIAAIYPPKGHQNTQMWISLNSRLTVQQELD